MRYILGSLFFVISIVKVEGQIPMATNNDSLDILFKSNFRILDSVALTKRATRYYCCTAQINFMENNTTIISSAEKTFMGKLSFNMHDLIKWHEWYVKRSRLLNVKE
jgi:hypothetical protein